MFRANGVKTIAKHAGKIERLIKKLEAAIAHVGQIRDKWRVKNEAELQRHYTAIRTILEKHNELDQAEAQGQKLVTALSAMRA